MFTVIIYSMSQWHLVNAVHRLPGTVPPKTGIYQKQCWQSEWGQKSLNITPQGCESCRNLSLGLQLLALPVLCFGISSACGFTAAIIFSHFWPPQRGKLSSMSEGCPVWQWWYGRVKQCQLPPLPAEVPCLQRIDRVPLRERFAFSLFRVRE